MSFSQMGDYFQEPRSSDIYSDIHEATNSLVRWKIQTDIGAQESRKKLEHSQGLASSQREKISELQVANEHLRCKLQEEGQKREDLEERLIYAKRELEVLSSQIAKLISRMDAIHGVNDKLKTKLLEKEDFLRSLVDRFESLKTETESKVKDTMEKLQKLEITSQSQKTALNNQIEDLEKSLDSSNAECESNMQRALAAENEIINLTRMLNDETKRLQAEVDNLIKEKDMQAEEAKEKESKLKSELDAAIMKNNDLAEETGHLKSKLADVSDQKDKLDRDLKDYSWDMEKLKQELEISRTSLSGKEAKLSDLNETIFSLNKELDNLKVKELDLIKLKEKYNMLMEDLGQSHESCRSLQIEVDMLKKTDQENFYLREEKTKLTTRVEQLEEEANINNIEYQAKLSHLQIQLNEAIKTCEELRQQKHNLTAKHDAEKNDLEDLCKNLKNKLAHMTDDLDCKNSEVDNLNKIIQELQINLDEKNATAFSSDNENLKLKEEIKLLSEKINNLEKEKNVSSTELSRLNDALESCAKSLEETKQDKDALQLKLVQEENVVVQLRETINKMKVDAEANQRDFSCEKSKLEKSVIAEKKREEKLVKQLEKNEASLKSANEKITSLTESSRMLEEKNSDLSNLMKQSEATIENLTKKMEAVESTKAELQEKLDLIKEEHEKSLIGFSSEKSKLENIMAAEKKREERLGKQVEKNKSTIKEAHEKLSKITKENKDMASKIIELSTTLEQRNFAFEQLEQEKADILQKVSSEKDLMTELKESADKMKEEYDNNLKSLLEEKSKLETNVADKNSNEVKLVLEVETLKVSLKEANNELAQIRSELESSKLKYDKLNEDKDVLNENFVDFTLQMEAKDSQLNALTERNETLILKLEEQEKTLSDKVKALQAELETAHGKIGALEKECRDANKGTAEESSRIRLFEEKLEARKEALDAAIKQRDDLRKELDKETRKNRKINIDFEQYKAKHSNEMKKMLSENYAIKKKQVKGSEKQTPKKQRNEISVGTPATAVTPQSSRSLEASLPPSMKRPRRFFAPAPPSTPSTPKRKLDTIKSEWSTTEDEDEIVRKISNRPALVSYSEWKRKKSSQTPTHTKVYSAKVTNEDESDTASILDGE